MPFWISIHTFLTEGDTGYHTCRCIFWYFNPHLPYGRWLGDTEMCWHCREFQSTPSLQKVTQGKRNKTAIAKFQSTPSLQKVTATYFACIKRLSISIHTFLAEGDSSRLQMLFAKMDFNPHLPCGRWPGLCKALFQCLNNFNPHLPCGRWQGCVKLSSNA